MRDGSDFRLWFASTLAELQNSDAGEFAIPDELPYAELRSLSTEARQKLGRLRPATLAQASRVPGVSASDIQNLVIEVERRRRAVTGS